MKQIAISAVTIYQIFVSTILKVLLGTNKFCRFEESCSAYAKRAIRQEGLVKGLSMGLIRLTKCQPFYRAY